MVADLDTITIEEATERLIDYRGKTPPKTGSGVRLITAKVVKGGQILDEPKEFIAADFYEEWMQRGLPQKLDVLITTEAPLGELAILRDSEKVALAQRIILLRARSGKVDPLFLFYALQSDFGQSELKARASGTTVSGIKQSELRQVRIPIFSLPVQKRIADILSAYDDLIENNQRRIRILEEMARSLYRAGFVHFRVPGHDKVKMVSSSLGPIPQGWEVKKLGNLISYNRFATKPGPHLDDRRYVPIDCLPSKNLALLEAKPIEEAQSSLQLFEKGDILFGAMRPYFHKVVVAPFAGVTRTTCFVLKPTRPEWHAFATMTAFRESTVAYANAHSQGATIPYAVWEGSLADMPLVIPPDALLRRFEKAVEPMLTRISLSFFVLTNLRRTRDLLLPRLLSGAVGTF